MWFEVSNGVPILFYFIFSEGELLVWSWIAFMLIRLNEILGCSVS